MRFIPYFRVSKEDEKTQRVEDQIPLVFEMFNIPKETKIYVDRGSAYDLNKLDKRKDLLQILRVVFKSDTITFEDLFLKKIEVEPTALCVWDYSRIFRNVEYSMFLSCLFDIYDIVILDYKTGGIIKKEDEKPVDKGFRYLKYAIQSLTAEDYSYNISTNVKKGVLKKDGVTYSSKHNRKWGRRFTGTKDNPRNNDKGKVELSVEEVIHMNKRIKKLLKQDCPVNFIPKYQWIIQKIAKELKVQISTSYISNIKNEKRK